MILGHYLARLTETQPVRLHRIVHSTFWEAPFVSSLDSASAAGLPEVIRAWPALPAHLRDVIAALATGGPPEEALARRHGARPKGS